MSREPTAGGSREGYAPLLTSSDLSPRTGSRTAAYLVAGALGTVPALLVLAVFLGFYGAVGGGIVMWSAGIVWLLKRRQEDPTWDHRPAAGRRSGRAGPAAFR